MGFYFKYKDDFQWDSAYETFKKRKFNRLVGWKGMIEELELLKSYWKRMFEDFSLIKKD